MLSAEKDTEPHGTYLRSYAEIGDYLYPFAKALGRRLVFSWTYQYRNDLAVPDTVDGSSHNFRTYSRVTFKGRLKPT